MSADKSWPTEDLATKAVDTAARAAFEFQRVESAKSTGIPAERYSDWDGIGRVVQLQWRQQVLPIVWAALTDLPDPRYAAFEEGRAAGSSDTAFESEGYGTPPSSYPHENPYPSGI